MTQSPFWTTILTMVRSLAKLSVHILQSILSGKTGELLINVLMKFLFDSVRLGNFLRAYPSARAMSLVYIVILHIWVAFILVYYEPEVHSVLDHDAATSLSKF